MKSAGRAQAGVRGAAVLAALGVVFGDIGTSPLYALKAVFALDGGLVEPTQANIFGVVSMVFWAITLIVSVKYVGFILHADDDGEGGVMALAHLAQRSLKHRGRAFTAAGMLGVIGAALFFGDSLITPAISVLSAIEGLDVIAPGASAVVVPLAAVLVLGLFAVQRYGTHRVGRSFGPIMVLWFAVLAVLGLAQIVQQPGVLAALSPHYALGFAIGHPGITFVAMAAIVLVVTGAEALYADMGHFGRIPIVWAWFAVVFPCLTLNYLGQAALIISDPAAISAPFFTLAPSWAQIPLVILAAMATIIASQAVMSGAFSVARQAERLGYLPRLTVRQTSEESGGQIYISSVNWALAAGVLVLLVTFGSSDRLAVAYGLAVTALLALTTVLFSIYAVHALGWRWWQVAPFAAVFGTIEVAFFAANIAKVLHGGWLTLLVAALLAMLMSTWWRGRELVTARREKIEGSLQEFLEHIVGNPKIQRVPGTAVFLHPNKRTTPLALRENVHFNRVMHDEVLIVSVEVLNVPHVDAHSRAVIDDLGDPFDHVTHVALRFGFSDHPDVPAGLAVARDFEGLDIDVGKVTYFISRINLSRSDRPGMSAARKKLFGWMARNAADPTSYYSLPVHRTVVLGAQVNY